MYQYFAARLNTQAGYEGQVDAPLCTNLKCHQEKVALAHPAPAATQDAPAALQSSGQAVKSRSKPAPQSTQPQTPKKVEVWVDNWLRQTAAEAVMGDMALCRLWVLYAVYKDAGQPEHILESVGIDKNLCRNRAEFIETTAKLSQEQIQQLLPALLKHLISERAEHGYAEPAQGELVRASVASLAVAKTDLTEAFTPNQGYWDAHTKGAIAAQLEQAKAPDGQSFAQWYQQQHADSETDTKAFERLMKGKMADIVTTLSKTAFDWSAWLPNVIAKRLKPSS